MAAGLGFKSFVTGDVLTAADVNGYLMQGVWVFANATARTAAVTSPQEGNVSFLKDTNSFEIYDGAAWVAYGSGDITGVTAGTGISGGGTAGDVTITNSMATAIDAKGDLIVGTGADTFSRLAVGTNNQALLADSTQATGLKWGAVPTTKSFSLLGTGTLTGATTITVSGISGIDDLYILVEAASSVNANSTLQFRMNGDSGANYSQKGIMNSANSSYAASQFNTYSAGNLTEMYLGSSGNNAGSEARGYITVRGCNTSGVKMITIGSGWNWGGGSGFQHIVAGGFWNNSATVSSVSLISASGNFDNGSYTVYGAA